MIAVGGVALAQLGDEVVHIVGAVARIVAAGGGGQREAGIGGNVEIQAAQGERIVAADELGLHIVARPGGHVSRDADGGQLIDDFVGGVGARGRTGLIVDENAQLFHLFSVFVAVAVVGQLIARAVQQRGGHQRIVDIADGGFIGKPGAGRNRRVGDGRHVLIGGGNQFAAVDGVGNRLSKQVLPVVVALEILIRAVDEQDFELAGARVEGEGVERTAVTRRVDRTGHGDIDALGIERVERLIRRVVNAGADITHLRRAVPPRVVGRQPDGAALLIAIVFIRACAGRHVAGNLRNRENGESQRV